MFYPVNKCILGDTGYKAWLLPVITLSFICNLCLHLFENIFRGRLPEKIYGELLPEGAKREESSANVPHRGKIFEINRPVPLSRPLFDGIDSEAVESSGLGEKSDSELGDKSELKISTDSSVTEKPKFPVTIERLPNGWSKKAVKHMTGKFRSQKT